MSGPAWLAAVACGVLAAAAVRAAPGPTFEHACREALAGRSGLILAGSAVTGRVLGEVCVTAESRDCNAPRPPGSLLKVPLFLEAATADPAVLRAVVACPGSSPARSAARSCWYRPGHGTVGFEDGLAGSCQRFAGWLCRKVDAAAHRARLADCGFRFSGPPPADETGWEDQLTGHAPAPVIAPRPLLAVLMACVNGGYLFDLERGGRLLRRLLWDRRAMEAVTAGLALAARHGTARDAGVPGALAKTGTTTRRDASGRLVTQGWAFVCRRRPDRQPDVALLVRLDTGSGAQAAAVAGQVLRSWSPARAPGR